MKIAYDVTSLHNRCVPPCGHRSRQNKTILVSNGAKKKGGAFLSVSLQLFKRKKAEQERERIAGIGGWVIVTPSKSQTHKREKGKERITACRHPLSKSHNGKVAAPNNELFSAGRFQNRAPPEWRPKQEMTKYRKLQHVFCCWKKRLGNKGGMRTRPRGKAAAIFPHWRRHQTRTLSKDHRWWDIGAYKRVHHASSSPPSLRVVYFVLSLMREVHSAYSPPVLWRIPPLVSKHPRTHSSLPLKQMSAQQSVPFTPYVFWPLSSFFAFHPIIPFFLYQIPRQLCVCVARFVAKRIVIHISQKRANIFCCERKTFF